MTNASPSRRRRVLVLTQHYRPEPNFVTADVAEHLARDARVTVVTTHPNYPLGRFYESATTWWWPRRSEENGVTVWRLPMIPDHSTSAIRRAVSYLSFAVIAALVAPWVMPRPDVVWVYNTPFTTPLAALWFRFVMRSRVIFTAADLWPESFVASGVVGDGVVIRAAAWYSRVTNRIAHDVVCVTEGIAARYRRDGITDEHLRVIRVWVDGVPEEARAGHGPADLRVVYAGNLGMAQQLDTVIRAAALLQSRGRRIQFDLYGTGVDAERLRALAASLGVSCVTFHGTVPAATAFERSRCALAQLVILRPSPLFAMTVPSKLYFCFAAAAPILYALEGEAATLVGSCGGGIAFDAASPETLCEAVERLLVCSADDRAAMSNALATRYNREFTRPVLLAAYDAVFGLATSVPVPAEGGAARAPHLTETD